MPLWFTFLWLCHLEAPLETICYLFSSIKGQEVMFTPLQCVCQWGCQCYGVWETFLNCRLLISSLNCLRISPPPHRTALIKRKSCSQLGAVNKHCYFEKEEITFPIDSQYVSLYLLGPGFWNSYKLIVLCYFLFKIFSNKRAMFVRCSPFLRVISKRVLSCFPVYYISRKYLVFKKMLSALVSCRTFQTQMNSNISHMFYYQPQKRACFFFKGMAMNGELKKRSEQFPITHVFIGGAAQPSRHWVTTHQELWEINPQFEKCWPKLFH